MKRFASKQYRMDAADKPRHVGGGRDKLSSTLNQTSMNNIADNLSKLNEQIKLARPPGQNEILLLGVSKGQSADKIRQAWQLGIHDFGENYLQEALNKQAQLSDLAIIWHFIGPLQSNKCRRIAAHFSWVHSVCQKKQLELLQQYRQAHQPALQICLQVNLTGESSKSGCTPEELSDLVKAVLPLNKLCLRGLMYIPPVDASAQQLLDLYQTVHQLLLQINHDFGLKLETLSMGMSEDLTEAIVAGSTIIRIGRALFGERT